MSGQLLNLDLVILWDVQEDILSLKPGELVLDFFESIEDTKAACGKLGRLLFTNQRIIWQARERSLTNITIGLHTITHISNNPKKNKNDKILEGISLNVKSLKDHRFEFIFTSKAMENDRLFKAINEIHKAYIGAKAYRDIMLRHNIIINNKLKLLPLEQVYNEIDGAINLASDQGNIGTFVTTNIRIVWFGVMNVYFNISIPYIQIATLKIIESKFGKAIVIETTNRASNYKLGFRIDPFEKLEEVFKEFQTLFKTHSVNPLYGVQYTRPGKSLLTSSKPLLDIVEIDDDIEQSDAFAAYFADGSHDKDGEPEFNDYLGLTMEKLPEGFTLADLWEVVNQDNIEQKQ